MKNTLLGTTALVALGALAVSPVAAAEEKIALSVGGYYESVVSYTDQSFDDPALDFHPVNVRQEGEIHFDGATTLDNGLTVGVSVQLEAVTQADQIDATYIYFEGDFGRVNVGTESAAPYLMAYAAPFVGLGVNSPNFLLFAQQGGAPTYSYLIGSGDANKLTYFTPRFSGFQFGISYTPNVDAPGGNRQTFGLSSDNDEDDQSDWISLGGNYENSFNGVDVAMSAGYERGNLEADADNSADDHTSWFVGGNLGFSGITVGGSYSVSNQGLSGNNDDTAFDVGVSYATGPWGISLAYLHGEQENGAVTTDDEVDLIELGASYALGPGIELAGAIQRWDETAIAPSADNDGWAVALQTRLSF